MAVDISNLPISSSFTDLVLVSGSYLQNATGSVINRVIVTASFADTASYAVSASYALNVPATASHALTAVSASYSDNARNADSALSASNAVNAFQATSASYADFAVSASVEILKELSSSYADVAALAQQVAGGDVIGTVDSASYAVVADSATSSSFAENARTASFALNSNPQVSASFATSASVADRASQAASATSASFSENAAVAVSASFSEGARQATSASFAADARQADTSITASHALTSVLANSATSASYAENASISNSTSKVDIIQTTQDFNYRVTFGISGSGETLYTSPFGQFNYNPGLNKIFNLGILDATSITGSLLGTASYALSASIADDIKDGIDVSFNSGSFNFISATSASFGSVRTVTGSAVIIGEEYIILNSDSPTLRYAGVKVYDSGSGLTGSFEWDSIDDNWFQVSTDGQSAGMLTGVKGTIGSEVYPSANTLLKGSGTNVIQNSIITDDGSTIVVGGDLTANVITANTYFVGDLIGTASVATTATTATNAVSASIANTATTAILATSAVSASFAENARTADSATSASFSEDARTADSATSASEATHAATATTASHAESIPGVISNDITFNGSVNGGVTALSVASSTASIDMSAGNFFTLAMPAGGAVHITATNKKAGQTINLQTTQNATAATLDWNSSFKFESGSQFAASTGSGVIDLMSFVTFDTSNVLGTGINNLI